MAVVGTGRDADRLAALAEAIGDPDRVATLAVDLTDDDAPQRIVELALSRWGRIDFLVNNAGVGSPKPLHETDDETLDYFLGVMLRAPFRLARDVIPHMQSGSAIINITSTFAVVGGLRGGAYSAAKGGLTALTLHIACQYGAQGIRCNAVAPGVTVTPMVEHRLRRRAVPQDQHRDDARIPGWAASRTSPRPWPSCARRAAASSTARPSWSTAAGVRRSISRSSRCPRNGSRVEPVRHAGPGRRPLRRQRRGVSGRALPDDVEPVAGQVVAAGCLAAGSHEPGTRIALASENRPEIVELFYAVWAAECVVVPVNFKLHPREMAQILEDSGAAAVFASPKIGPNLAAVSSAPVEIIGSADYESRFGAAPRTVPATDPARLAWLFYTSGTTGRSKGAMLSHRNLTAMTVAHLADIDSPDHELQPGARRPDVARLGSLHRAVRVARRPPGPAVLRGIRSR